MKLIKADPDRRIDIPGAGLVPRPVDIDQSRTAFKNLRSLRIYRFDGGMTIDGHAEEDEVFVVVLAGLVEFATRGAPPEPESCVHHLSAPGDLGSAACAAYLPPRAAYRLVASSDSVVAYARATPASGKPPASFQANSPSNDTEVQTLLAETTYAQRLRLRLFHIRSNRTEVNFTPVSQSEADREALVHIQIPAGGGASASFLGEPDPLSIASWETLVINPGEHPTLHFARGLSVVALVVSAH